MKRILIAGLACFVMLSDRVQAAQPPNLLDSKWQATCKPYSKAEEIDKACRQWIQAHAREDKRLFATVNWEACDNDIFSKPCEQWIMASWRYDYLHPIRPPCDPDYGSSEDGNTCIRAFAPPWAMRLEFHDSLVKHQRELKKLD